MTSAGPSADAVGIAIVGAGWAGTQHAQAYLSLGSTVRIVAVVDQHRQLAVDRANDWNALLSTDDLAEALSYELWRPAGHRGCSHAPGFGRNPGRLRKHAHRCASSGCFASVIIRKSVKFWLLLAELRSSVPPQTAAWTCEVQATISVAD